MIYLLFIAFQRSSRLLNAGIYLDVFEHGDRNTVELYEDTSEHRDDVKAAEEDANLLHHNFKVSTDFSQKSDSLQQGSSVSSQDFKEGHRKIIKVV